MNIENLIPKDKFDIETAEKLKNYSFEEIKPIIPNLLEWLQDLNWPVSQLIADFLIPYSENIAFEIFKILQGRDEMWKYWILLIFGKIIKNELVIKEVNRIVLNPTFEEIDAAVYELAKE
ncbi:DUF5071 domain-containing protein [Flavobacterium aquiphilum]|uniref:DUF5071 domain-containing protein n=1 Tax=Flavobacterium aquiphilum TaxID=3003261 RepID=UPI002480938F|nr:DUF5071 domain-containing protein [Flavobacterium aquiphilum]